MLFYEGHHARELRFQWQLYLLRKCARQDEIVFPCQGLRKNDLFCHHALNIQYILEVFTIN